MNRGIRTALLLTLLVTLAAPFDLLARRVVVRRARVTRTTVVVRPGHPIRRVLPAAVVVRPARVAVAVAAPLVFLPAVMWRPTVVALPGRDRLIWEDSDVIEKEDDWVDSNFGVDRSGDALYLEIRGKAQLNFAEVTFANGNVQVVDFEDHTRDSGIYPLLDFADGRHVKTVRVLARSKSRETKLIVYMRK